VKTARTILVAVGFILFLVSCAPPKKTVTVEAPDQKARAEEAASLVRKGHYLAFKKAVRLYAGLWALPSLRPKIAGPYLEACLLLALREKEIGIDNPVTVAAAERLIGQSPALAGFSACATLISAIPARTLGIMRDIDTSHWTKAGADALQAAEEKVRKSAAQDDFSAGILAALTCSVGLYSERWRDPVEDLKRFPDSLLIKYEAAICGEGRPELLEEILAQEPDFAEADFHLGQAALKRGQLIEAENHLLKAYAAIPESPQMRILLAGIYFATEEFDRSLRFYDLTLEAAPEYRDALLGKAICLSFLGRHEEAMAVLDGMLELGYWLLGEAHYWLAWNLHELKRDPEALHHADEAKGRLPTNSEVFGLAGTMALDLGELDRSEKDFLESLKYNPANTESLFGLGVTCSRRDRWEESAAYYEKAGRASEAAAAAVVSKVEEIKGSALSEDRKARLVRRREAQVERLRLSSATAYYDAAAAFLNAGLKDKAAAAAGKAAAHPALKQKAEDLLRSVKK
jgi:tetratricopeptide (TPR) repeat protein